MVKGIFKAKKKRELIVQRPFTAYEEVILRCLIRGRRKLTTRQIARIIGISWITAKGHLEELEKKNKVKKEVLDNRTYWEIK